MGLGQVRELTRKAVGQIVAARAGRPFDGLGDLVERVELRAQEITHLIQCGALDGLGGDRKALLAQASGVTRRRAQRRSHPGQLGLPFELEPAPHPPQAAPPEPPSLAAFAQGVPGLGATSVGVSGQRASARPRCATRCPITCRWRKSLRRAGNRSSPPARASPAGRGDRVFCYAMGKLTSASGSSGMTGCTPRPPGGPCWCMVGGNRMSTATRGSWRSESPSLRRERDKRLHCL